MLLDLHVHTSFSLDCLSSPEELLRVAKRRGLNGIAVTDHDTVRGGLAARQYNRDPSFHVIVGSEVSTDAGDIIGLFLEEEIRSHKPLEVIAEIHAQGGVVLLPHPFRGRPPREEVVRGVDLVEVFNARMDPDSNRKAQELTARLGKRAVCGSDAHFLSDLGTCRVAVDGSDIRAGLLGGSATLQTGYSPRYRTSVSQIIKAWRSRTYRAIPYHTARLLKRLAFDR